MRHKYATTAVVLARASLGEASASLALLTKELGLVRARVQSIRRSGAKLQGALQTFAQSDIVLIRGKEGWRVSGAVLQTNWSRALTREARARSARVATLLLRLVHGETHDPALFSVFSEFLEALEGLSPHEQDVAECLVALRLLRHLGLDAGDIPGGADGYAASVLAEALSYRKALVARVNHGIAASGL